MIWIEGKFWDNHIVVRKVVTKGTTTSYKVQLGGDLEYGSPSVVLSVATLEAATALYTACQEIIDLEVRN